jgi:competence protein ComEC
MTLIEQMPVGRLWTAEAGRPPGQRSREALDPAWGRVLEAAARRGVPVTLPEPLVLGAVSIDPLGPCAPEGTRCPIAPHPEHGHNDNSVVLLVRYAGRALLFPGDLELPGELALLEALDRRPDRAGLLGAARLDVLKAPHHCSRTSSSESLITELLPRLVICSVGAHNRYGFPHDEVVARYRAAGVPLLRTDEHGAVQVAVAPDGRLSVRAMRGF